MTATSEQSPTKPVEASAPQEVVAASPSQVVSSAPPSKPGPPSRWNQPLADYDVKVFYQNYMPWLNATTFVLRRD